MPSKGMGKCGVDVLIYLSSYGLFNDADSSVYVVLNGTVIVYDELERLQSWRMPGGTEENYRASQSR
jgi:hypothetical protein